MYSLFESFTSWMCFRVGWWQPDGSHPQCQTQFYIAFQISRKYVILASGQLVVILYWFWDPPTTTDLQFKKNSAWRETLFSYDNFWIGQLLPVADIFSFHISMVPPTPSNIIPNFHLNSKPWKFRFLSSIN